MAICVSTFVVADEKSQLVFSLDLIRHGDRTPFKKIPNISYEWKQGLGQLTSKGMRQEYELGVKLRKKYVERYQLLPKGYQSEALYVRSTDFDRTLMSAQSLLLGLYPLGTGSTTLPQRYQPIPIHTVSHDHDPLLIKFNTQKAQELASAFHESAEWKAKEAVLKKHFAHWSYVTGMKISSLNDVVSLADALYIYQLNNVSIPILSQNEIKQIIESGYEALIMPYKKREIGKEVAAPLLKVIYHYLNNATQNSTLKYVLLSAHDSTILAIMSAMGSPLNEIPPYASIINFSLFKKGEDNYILEITYNNKAILIPGCVRNRCSLAEIEPAWGLSLERFKSMSNTNKLD